jgi:Tfp pilus assembly protein PilO
MQFGWRTFLFVVLLLGMLVLSYPLLFKPLKDQRELAVDETQKNQQKLRDLAGVMAKTENMDQDMEQLAQAIKLLESKLPAATEMDKVLQDVWQKAKDNNLSVKSVRNAKPVDGAMYSEQPIHMVIEGKFAPGFYKFLSQVEQMERLTKINEMKVDADQKNPGLITADFVLTIYYEGSQKVAVAK